MKQILVLCLAALLATAAPLRAATDPGTLALAGAFGSTSGIHLVEAYVSLTDAEKALNTSAASIFSEHLQLQVALLNLQLQTFDNVGAAFPDDKDLQALIKKLKDTATAIVAQNEAIQAYIGGKSKDIEGIRKKHAASKALLVPLLNLQDGGKSLP